MTTTDPYAGERLKRTAFYPRAKVLNIRDAWAAWNGYKFADQYYDAEYEYFCVRNTCATYDICPMQKYEIKGRDAEAMLNRMVTRDVAKIGMNRVAYCVWCTDEGRMIDDGTIFKLSDDKFMLTCGSPCTAWLEMSSFGFDDVTVKDVTDDFAALSLQGPTSCATLKKMGLNGIETAKPFDIRYFPFHGDTLMVSRTGFTGDLGYELWIQRGLALEMWDELYAAGEDYGIQPFGEAATNMARLEAAFIMPAMEFNEALEPWLAGGFQKTTFQWSQRVTKRKTAWTQVHIDQARYRGKQARRRLIHLQEQALHQGNRLCHISDVVTLS